MAKPIGNPRFHARDTSGADLALGYVLTYAAGTTSAKAVYQDSSELVVHPGPASGPYAGQTGFVLDTRGEAAVYWGLGKYKLRFYRADHTLVREVDQFDPGTVTTQTETENAQPNGSFENTSGADGSPDGWELTMTGGDTLPVRTVTVADHGAAALMFETFGGPLSGGAGAATTRDYLPVAAGRPLDVLWRMRSELSSLRSVVYVRWYDAARIELGGSPGTVYDQTFNNPTVFTEFHGRAMPPAGARYARLELRGAAPHATSPQGKVWFDGVLLRTVGMENLRTLSASATLGHHDFGTVLVDATGGAVAVTLPSASGAFGEFALVRIDASANAVTVQPAGADTIDGGGAFTLRSRYASRRLCAGGGANGWLTVARAGHPVVIQGNVLTQDPVAPGTTLSGTHGLGAPPSSVAVKLVCKTTDLGYAVGDEVMLGGYDIATASRTLSVNATSVTVSHAGTPSLVRKDTLAVAAITAAAWKLQVTPYLITSQ
ncbi:MAG: hypothetical protein OEW11_07855 [Nitrospirota bacterium]|nr:hypothetical protein [Nitrospirota bacterium]